MSMLTAREHAPAPERAKSGKRLDIQGAFVGVDVFFVISGFLITSLLLRDLDRDLGLRGHVAAFYRARVRRLLPASLTVTVLAILGAKLLLDAARYTTTLHDGLWATVFWVNWHFASSGTVAFAGAPQSPFQHYWSLSVAEQFYLVWPVLLFLGGLALVGRGRLSRHSATAVVAGVVCVLSLAVAVVQSGGDPTYAYFSSITRAWELGLGALLACVGGRLRASRPALTAMSWVGLIVICASFFLVRGGAGFPFPGALAPCLGSALVLAAVSGEERASNIVLTNRASVFVGDISYSVYLVHLPVIVLLSGRMLDSPWYYYVTALGLTAGLSLALYGFIEQPVLRSRWLLTESQRTSQRRGGLAAAPRFHEYGVDTTVMVVLSLVVLVYCSARIWPPRWPSRTPRPELRSRTGPREPRPRSPADRWRRPSRQLVEVVNATAWPALDPDLGSVLAAPASTSDIGQCGGTTLIAEQCVFGDRNAKHTIELVGDSQSIAWAPAFQALVTKNPDWNVRVAGGFACVFADTVIVTDAGSFSASCAARNRAVVSDRWTGASALDSTRLELGKVSDAVGAMVMLTPPPPVTDPHTCYRLGSTPGNCLTELAPTTRQGVSNQRSVMARAEGTVIDTKDWFCADGYCPEFAAGSRRTSTAVTSRRRSAPDSARCSRRPCGPTASWAPQASHRRTAGGTPRSRPAARSRRRRRPRTPVGRRPAPNRSPAPRAAGCRDAAPRPVVRRRSA